MDQDKSKKKNRGVHREDDDTNGPAIDELVVPLIIFRLIDDFGREVTWGPTHRLRNRAVTFVKHLSKEDRDIP